MLMLAMMMQAALPDIQLNATVQARSLTIEKQGEARLEVSAQPDAGSAVKAEAPKANGAKRLRNVRVTVDAEARIGSGVTVNAETGAAEPR